MVMYFQTMQQPFMPFLQVIRSFPRKLEPSSVKYDQVRQSSCAT